MIVEQITNSASVAQFPFLAREGEGSVVSASSEIGVDSIFPAPGLILNELY